MLLGEETMGDFRHDLCIVRGAGHIGLPLALVFASEGLDVAIYDVNKPAVMTPVSWTREYCGVDLVGR